MSFPHVFEKVVRMILPPQAQRRAQAICESLRNVLFFAKVKRILRLRSSETAFVPDEFNRNGDGHSVSGSTRRATPGRRDRSCDLGGEAFYAGRIGSHPDVARKETLSHSQEPSGPALVMKDRPNYREVTRCVRSLLEDYGYENPPVNPVAIARDQGFTVSFARFTGKFSGASGYYDPSEDRIVVNKEEPPQRQTFTIAHELGHALLHQEWAETDNYKIQWRDSKKNDNKNPYEKEANAFAAHLLVPRKMLDQFSHLSDVQLSKLFAVSAQVIRNRRNFEYGE